MVTGSPTVGVAAETVALTIGLPAVTAAKVPVGVAVTLESTTAETGITRTNTRIRNAQVIKHDLHGMFMRKNEAVIGIRVMVLFFSSHHILYRVLPVKRSHIIV